MQSSSLPSYWEQDVFLKPFDVLVIGCGIVGLNAAISLKAHSAALRVGVVDREVLPAGASTRNAGFACFGSISEIIADIRAEGFDNAVARVAQRKAGLDMLLARAGKEALHYERTGGYEVFLAPDHERLSVCLDQIDELNRSLAGTFGGAAFTPVSSRAGLRDVLQVIAHPHEGCLHPGEMIARLLSLAQQDHVLVLPGVAIADIEESVNGITLISDTGRRLAARYAVVATNGFTRTLLPGLNVVPTRNQVYLTVPVPHLQVHGCYHYNEGYVYFRDVGNRLLIGGARHIDPEGEATDQYGFTEPVRNWLMAFAERHITGFTPEVAFQWSGIMGVGQEKQPIVRMISDRIAVGVRLGGMGVAIGSLIGDQVATLITERL